METPITTIEWAEMLCSCQPQGTSWWRICSQVPMDELIAAVRALPRMAGKTRTIRALEQDLAAEAAR